MVTISGIIEILRRTTLKKKLRVLLVFIIFCLLGMVIFEMIEPLNFILRYILVGLVSGVFGVVGSYFINKKWS